MASEFLESFKLLAVILIFFAKLEFVYLFLYQIWRLPTPLTEQLIW